MKILHICSGYANTKLYDQLITNLEHSGGVEQFVYVPVRSKEEIDLNRNENLTKTRYRFAHILRGYHRALFGRKIAAVFRDLATSVDARSFSVAHAHFLYSDGAVALKLKQEYGLPYITTVRNTDLNFFMRYRPDLMPICREILGQASAVIFVTPAYREELLAKLPDRERDAVFDKSHIVPNGVAAFWLEHPPDRQVHDQSSIRLLYVGDFSPNKNVPNTIRAADIVARKFDTRLTLVGGGRNGAKIVSDMLKSGCYPGTTFAGRIDSREELLTIYRDHDIYVMPSFLETFGLSYIEALSQGLPVVHSRGQGVQGYFDRGTVSEEVDPHDPASIANAIQTLANRLPAIGEVCVNQARRFDWTRIARVYVDLYKKAQAQA